MTQLTTISQTIGSQNFHFHFHYPGRTTHHGELDQCRCAAMSEANKQEALRCFDCVDHMLSLKTLVSGRTETEAGGVENGAMMRVWTALRTLICCGRTRNMKAGGQQNEGMRVWKAQMQVLQLKLEELLQEAFGVLLHVQEFRRGAM